ncbi:MAG TPA: hypothetical protein DCS15_05610 [Flavobacteriales bacterium]|jgi:hypothetical protein|nr:DUF6438 domain-containing protein [Salibacteraceae bacterium]HAS35942.1 hypothetical protein [Flavobacteriales bacterium]
MKAFFLGFVVLLSSCASSPKESPKIQYIEYSKSVSGISPDLVAYNLRINEKGEVKIKGLMNTPKTGNYKADLKGQMGEALWQRLMETDFSKLKTEYGMSAEDSQTKSLTYALTNSSGRIQYKAMEPAILKELEVVFDAVVRISKPEENE